MNIIEHDELINEFINNLKNPNLTVNKAIKKQGLIGYKDQLEDAIEYTFIIIKKINNDSSYG